MTSELSHVEFISISKAYVSPYFFLDKSPTLISIFYLIIL